MSETRNIIVLGASYSGLGASHYVLKHVYPQLPSEPGIAYKVILVNPSKKWYQRHAAPRAIASPELMPNEQTFLDIEPGFKQYGDKFQFVLGKAVSWDTEKRVVFVKKNAGQELALSYHALILATGSKTMSPTQSNWATSFEETQEALAAIHEKLKSASSIVIAGGGPAGVETAGELGELLNGVPGWFQSQPSNIKVDITVLTSSDQLLPALRPALGKQAEAYLHRVGVNVSYKTKLQSAAPSTDGTTKIVLQNGKELNADIYIPAMGYSPLTSYVPARLLNEKGAVIANESTLRVDKAGPRVYAMGDVASFSRGGIMEIMDETPVLATNLKRDLLAAHKDPNGKATGTDRIYTPNLTETQLVPVGQSKGVGAVLGWKLPSWAVYMIKGKDFMTPKGNDLIYGKSKEKEVKWKEPAVAA